MVEDSKNILERIDAYCEEAGIKPTTFGGRHFKNSRLYSRLQKGGGLTLDTYRKLSAILDAGPPQKTSRAKRPSEGARAE